LLPLLQKLLLPSSSSRTALVAHLTHLGSLMCRLLCGKQPLLLLLVVVVVATAVHQVLLLLLKCQSARRL
jgi:hypothetical protein